MTEIKDFISRFGFYVTPFTCEFSIEERFIKDNGEKSVEQLYRCVDKRMCAALVAPAGAGKTVTIRSLINRLPETRYRTHYVNVTDLSKRDMCREIATVAGIESTGNYSTLVKRLQEHFTSSLEIDGLRPVLILDEAHDIRRDVLAILRILTNFNMDSRLVVSILLVGQPPLAKKLRHAELEDVTRRLSHYATLSLLSKKETAQYIKHRCTIAGASSLPFATESVDVIYEIGRGNMRATDFLALKSLEVAHDQDCDVVNSNHAVEARRLLWPS